VIWYQTRFEALSVRIKKNAPSKWTFGPKTKKKERKLFRGKKEYLTDDDEKYFCSFLISFLFSLTNLWSSKRLNFWEVKPQNYEKLFKKATKLREIEKKDLTNW
jgi:hypothetical protein